MAKNALDSVLHYLRRMALTGSDARLLERFAREGDEAAFERLVVLHGPHGSWTLPAPVAP